MPQKEIAKTCESVYDKIENCIKLKGRLTNYLANYFKKIFFALINSNVGNARVD